MKKKDEIKEAAVTQKELDYGWAKAQIKDKLMDMSKSFIQIGYLLRAIKADKMYMADGYRDVWEFSEGEYGIKRTTTDRWMKMNEEFSVGGNSPYLAEKYKVFGKSQLQELLYFSAEDREKITPDMTVKEIREVKNFGRKKKKEEQEFCDVAKKELSAYGTEKRVYPEGSLIATEGCDGGHHCVSCHLECQIRQKYCYCVFAPMGNPFPCKTLDIIQDLRQDVGNECQFINLDMAFHRAGDGEPVPCCKDCKNPCGYQCDRAKAKLEAKKEPVDAEAVVIEPIEESEELDEELSDLTDMELAQKELDGLHLRLKEVKMCFSENDVTVRKLKVLIAALGGYICELDNIMNPPPEPVQPELPPLKNSGQRKEWLENHRAWGLWYEDEHIGCKYYKYDFDNGARLIAEEYKTDYGGRFTLLHLIGGPEPPKGKYGSGKWERHKRYNRFPNSETELIEFLKYVQKKK